MLVRHSRGQGECYTSVIHSISAKEQENILQEENLEYTEYFYNNQVTSIETLIFMIIGF